MENSRFPFKLSGKAVQKARGDAANVDREEAKDLLREHTRELLEEDRRAHIEMHLVRLKTLCEVLSDNVHFPASIILEEAIRKIEEEQGTNTQEHNG